MPIRRARVVSACISRNILAIGVRGMRETSCPPMLHHGGVPERTCPPRFSVFVAPGVPWSVTNECIRLADELEFDTLWMPDHLYSPYDQTMPQLDGWTAIAAAAASTERVRLGVLVSNPAYRAPAVLAALGLSLDELSGGRAEIAIGTGWFAPDFSMVGEQMLPPGERVGRLRETAEIVDRLMRGDARPYLGTHFRVEDAAVAMAPIQQPRPPLTVAANGPRAIRIAAELSDCWTTWKGEGIGTGEFAAEASNRAAVLDRACADIGRDPKSIRRSILVSPPHVDPWRDAGSRLSEDLNPYREAGFDEFILRWPADIDPGLVEHVARDVLPGIE